MLYMNELICNIAYRNTQYLYYENTTNTNEAPRCAAFA